MKEIIGSFNSAKIFADTIDENALDQIKVLCDQEFIKDSMIRIMPDVHAGKGCTVGTTLTIKDKIVPNLVGVDIGCGMLTYKLKEKSIKLEKLDKFINSHIPSGMDIRKNIHKYIENINLENLRCFKHINKSRATHSLGSLGGGNHFIEVDKDENNNLYLVIHSGSRYLGKQIAEYYQLEAFRTLNNNSNSQINEMIEKLKKEGKETEIEKALEQIKKQNITDIPESLAYVEGKLFEDYINDMKITQEYAVFNRKAMADDIISALGLEVEESFTTIHNYIDTDAMILRKGAVSAKQDEKLLIPINMRDGSLICIGKGNPDWNYSAPHGAGRLYSRQQAKNKFTLEKFEKSMKGIYSTSINKSTIDECPMAYKNMEEIVDNITPTAEIIDIIKPIYNFKASDIPSFKKGK